MISTFSIFVSLEVATSHHVDLLFEDHNSLSLFVAQKHELLVSYSSNCNPSWYLPASLPDLEKNFNRCSGDRLYGRDLDFIWPVPWPGLESLD